MNRLFTYIPPIIFIIVILFIDNSVVRWVLLPVIVCLIVFSKYKHSNMQNEEIEYDDRVNNNILKWSLRSMFILNTLLILFLFSSNQNILKIDFTVEMILVYLVITLFIPFYIVPLIIKHF